MKQARKPAETPLFELKPETRLKLATLSKSMGRIEGELLEEAVTQYCDYQTWKYEAIEKGIRAADAGLLSSSEDVLKRLELKRAACL